MKFVPAERVKYADACEIACGSEMRFARGKVNFVFQNRSGISPVALIVLDNESCFFFFFWYNLTKRPFFNQIT